MIKGKTKTVKMLNFQQCKHLYLGTRDDMASAQEHDDNGSGLVTFDWLIRFLCYLAM